MKICCKCKGKKELTEFYRNRSMRDGLNPMCKPCAKAANLKDVKKHKTKRLQSRKVWREANRNKIRDYNSKWWRNAWKTKPNVKIAALLRNRIADAMHGRTKRFSALDCGCTIEELKMHIEKQFKPGMSWENYSFTTWHIDHKKPLSSFNLQDPEQFKKAVHYTNLQPLWASENLLKGAK